MIRKRHGAQGSATAASARRKPGPKLKPARLMMNKRPGRPRTYYILFNGRSIQTGTTELQAAQRRLGAFIAEQAQASTPPRPDPLASDIGLILDEEAAQIEAEGGRSASGRATHVKNLLGFWRGRPLRSADEDACRKYLAHRTARAVRFRGEMRNISSYTVRIELQALKRILGNYCAAAGLAWRPAMWLPPRVSNPTTWLTRDEVIRLLLAARGRVWDREGGGWRRTDECLPDKPEHKLLHLEPEHARALTRPFMRLIVLGAWTGSRAGAMLDAGWSPSPARGHIDGASVFHRMGSGETETSKRRPAVKLLEYWRPLVRTWARRDALLGADQVIHDGLGGPLPDYNRRWKRIVENAGLGPEVVLHTLRHSCAVWLLEGGTSLEVAAEFLGMTVETLTTSYDHWEPRFTQAAADALDGLI